MHIRYQRPEKSNSKGDSEVGFLKSIWSWSLIRIFKTQKSMVAKHEIIYSRLAGLPTELLHMLQKE